MLVPRGRGEPGAWVEGTIDGRIGRIGCFLSFLLEGRTRTIADGSEGREKPKGQLHPWEETGRTLVPMHHPMEKRKMGERNGWKRDPRPFQTKVHPLPPPWMTSKGDTSQEMAAGRRHTSPTRKMVETLVRSSARIDGTGEPHGDVSWNVSSIVAVPIVANHVDGFHRQDTIRVRAVFDHGQRACFVDGTNSDPVLGVGQFFVSTRMSHAQRGKDGFVSCHVSAAILLPFEWHSIFLVVDAMDPSMVSSIHPSVSWLDASMHSFGSFPPSTSFDPTLCHGWVGSTIPSMGSVPFPVPPKTSFHLVP